MKFEVLDKNGRVTSLSQRLVYRVATDRGFLWAGHGGTPTGNNDVKCQPISGGSEWHKNSNECEWSIHEVPGSNRRKYYIVTKGKVLHASQGISYNGNDRNGRSHNVDGLGKSDASEWHKTGPESQWEFEELSPGWFRISTSHKVLWLGSNNPELNVRGLNKNSGMDWHMSSNECKWQFVPKLGTYTSRIYDFDYNEPFNPNLTAEQLNLEPEAMITYSYDNTIKASEETFVYEDETTKTHTTTVGFAETASMTLSRTASVSVEASVPGVGDASATVETGMELSGSLERNRSCTVTKTARVKWSVSLKVPGGSKGRLTILYFNGPFEVPFTCKCDLKATVKIAAEGFLSTANCVMEPAYDAMLKAALKGAGFDKPDSQIINNYHGDRATFQQTGTLCGDGGHSVRTQVRPDNNTEMPAKVNERADVH